MRTVRPVPESYIAVSVRSMQTPLKGPHSQVCPAVRLPLRLLANWDIDPDGDDVVSTQDYGSITIMSPDTLPGSSNVQDRKVQARGLVTLPPNLARAHASPDLTSSPIGIVDWNQERVAVITSQGLIAERLGSVSMHGIGAADQGQLRDFSDRIQHCPPRHEAVLDVSNLRTLPTGLMAVAFPELVCVP
jgi:hypothetical protein